MARKKSRAKKAASAAKPARARRKATRPFYARARKRTPLASSDLRWSCDPADLPFESTLEVEPVNGVVGQDIAVDALRFGLQIHAPGQNVFVRGLTGTGRMTLVARLLEEIRLECPQARDRCYVHNFAQPDRPRLVTLPRGRGRAFARHMDDLADFIRDQLETALSSEAISARQAALELATQRKIEEHVEPFEKSLREAGLSLTSLPGVPGAQALLLPLIDGQPVSPDQWQQLRAAGKVTGAEADRFKEQHDRFQQELRGVMQKVGAIRRSHADEARSLRSVAARAAVGEFVDKIRVEFPEPSVAAFLDEVVEEVAVGWIRKRDRDADDTRSFRVNVVLCHEDDVSCPMVIESAPTARNLLGNVDQRFDAGQPGGSDHMMIRTGALLRADGGYLILDARDVLREPGAWPALTRTLKTGHLEIVPAEAALTWWGPTLKPEPVDISVKVILLGDGETYDVLDTNDPDFPHLFKVLADFDSTITRDDEGIRQYGGVLARIVQEERLPHFASSAVAALVEHGARIAGRKDRLTTRFGRLADIAREAAFIARGTGDRAVGGDDVRHAIARTKNRASLPSRRFRELLADGTIRVSLSGEAVGQVNGLAVAHAGPLTYGFPTRITATIGPGSAGVINIEREADLSGAIHTKGFYILGGLLRHLLRTSHPLAFHASIAFEQTYGGIDGDSASGAEICCLLSALTGIPLRQDLAMTGAVDQVGHILAIGATNEKIEGFFDTCRETGFTGTQGVLIPKANARDLMLRRDLVEACGSGKFRVYTVDTVGEALELLTGVASGLRGDDGQYPEDSLLGVAVVRAFEYWVMATQSVGAIDWQGRDVPAGDET